MPVSNRLSYPQGTVPGVEGKVQVRKTCVQRGPVRGVQGAACITLESRRTATAEGAWHAPYRGECVRGSRFAATCVCEITTVYNCLELYGIAFYLHI